MLKYFLTLQTIYMKQFLLIFAVLIAMIAQAQLPDRPFARDSKGHFDFKNWKYDKADYLKNMTHYVAQIKKAKYFQDYNILAHRFATMAAAEQSKWIPYYHAAYCAIMAALYSKEKFKIEDMLNQAQQALDNAFALRPNHSELLALQGFLYQGRIRVNPEKRSKEYTKKAIQAYDQARFADPKNPRASFLTGYFLYYMPKAWGGGKTPNTLKHFEEAAVKFEAYKPKSEFSPNWGQAVNSKLLKKCKE